MGFWIYMMVMELLIPMTMVGFGKYFSKNAPKEINGVFGYRTSMSMKNKDTWEFAHHCCGKVWLKAGTIMLILTVAAMLFVVGKDTNAVGTYGLILCGIQLGFLIGSIFPVEAALKKNFDKHGRRK
jgi:uncharacterized membrane protein